MGEEVEETNTGVKKTGSWEDISRFGKKVEKALKTAGIKEESVKRFSDWRPRVEEAEADVKEKTLEAATIEEKEIEVQEENVKKHLGDASDKIAEAGDKVKQGETPEHEIAVASKDAAIPLVSKIFKALRILETFIYDKFIMRFNSFYLDTGDLSVNVSNAKKGNYTMDVKVSREEHRDNLHDSFGAEEK